MNKINDCIGDGHKNLVLGLKFEVVHMYIYSDSSSIRRV